MLSRRICKKDSIVISSHSSGVIDEENVSFDVLFECLICHPVEGQIINVSRKYYKSRY